MIYRRALLQKANGRTNDRPTAMRTRDAGWWVVEVGMPALGVLAGVSLLGSACTAMVLGAPRSLTWQLFAWGLGLWAGGIAWGALVNDGVPGLRDP
jgi:hypothetical protein